MASFIAGFTNSALVTFGLVFCLTVVLEVRASLLDPSLISHELRSFANNALGVEELQVSKTCSCSFHWKRISEFHCDNGNTNYRSISQIYCFC